MTDDNNHNELEDQERASLNHMNFLGDYEEWLESNQLLRMVGTIIVKEDYSAVTVNLTISLENGSKDSMDDLLNRIQSAVLLTE